MEKKNNIYDFIEVSDGDWNVPSINSYILGIFNNGYAPKFRGGCMGIIPNGDKFLILGEDDDHYFDECNVSKEDLITLMEIMEDLTDSISVVIDFVKCTSKSTYKIIKKDFFDTDHSINNFKVDITDRDKSAPLVTIKNDNIGLSLIFDISWAKHKLHVMKQVLKQ